MSLPRSALALALAAALLSPACATTDAQVADGPAVEPSGPPPGGPPPPPPEQAAAPDGQWVFTQQYGWVWLPYGDAYTYLPPGGSGEPLEYVFYGSLGWTWVAAPWVWGTGPSPYFGRSGPRHYAWYQRGTHRPPQRGRYAPEASADRRGVRPPPRAGRAPQERPGRERGRGEDGFGGTGHGGARGADEGRGGGADGGRGGGGYEPRGRRD